MGFGHEDADAVEHRLAVEGFEDVEFCAFDVEFHEGDLADLGFLMNGFARLCAG